MSNALNEKHMRMNTQLIDTCTLTMDHMKRGHPCEGDRCPIAIMIDDEYKRIQYEKVYICRKNIEYTLDRHEILKENAWTLLALIHAIDQPNVPVYAINRQTGVLEHLFAGDKGIHVPLTIEEYQDFFNLVLPNHPKAHLDDYELNSRFNNKMDLIELSIKYTRKEL